MRDTNANTTTNIIPNTTNANSDAFNAAARASLTFGLTLTTPNCALCGAPATYFSGIWLCEADYKGLGYVPPSARPTRYLSSDSVTVDYTGKMAPFVFVEDA